MSFVKVRCKCKNEQVVFDRAAMDVTCHVCSEALAKPSGGKTVITAQVLEVLE